jgi:4-amino-4-deoxy-L-arabinose transferase-like glycosyltransferase
MSAALLAPVRPPSAGLRLSARSAARALVLLAAVGHVAYLLLGCPLDLSPDEAHYWDWSRRLDWSYYSKGPLVALLIRVGCECFGDTAFAVRLPAVVCNALLLLGVRRLAADVFRSDRLAVAAVAAGLTLPPLAAGAVLMTTDAPFLAAWAWAAVFARRAAFGDRPADWLAAGGCVAVGVLAKYTMLALPGCVGLFLLADRDRRHLLRGCGFWAMAGVGLLGLVPVVGWNAAHGWVGLWHVTVQAGAATGPKIGFDPLRPFEFAAGQFGFLAGYWFCAWAAAAWAFRPGRATPGVAFLWWLSVPVVAAFLVTSVRAKPQPNWPAAGYLSGLVLAVVWVARQLRSESIGYRRLVVGLLAGGTAIAVGLTAVAHYPGIALPLFAAAAGPPTDADPAPVRKVDPMARLRGWRHLAAAVDQVRDEVLAEDGAEPLVAGMVWTLPGELGFYGRGHPGVYSFGAALEDRASQYDVWRPNPVADAQAFAGRTFVYVGETSSEVAAAFERLDGPRRVAYRENGVTVGEWKIWVGRGFRGFPGRGRPPRY